MQYTPPAFEDLSKRDRERAITVVLSECTPRELALSVLLTCTSADLKDLLAGELVRKIRHYRIHSQILGLHEGTNVSEDSTKADLRD